VTLVEAGPDYGPIDGGGWPNDLLDATGIPETHDWGYAGASGEGRPLPFERARVIGGCSSHNGCAQCAGWRGDYDAWAAADCPGWSGADLEPLFTAVASRMRFRRYRETEIQPFQRAFLEAVTAAGVNECPLPNARTVRPAAAASLTASQMSSAAFGQYRRAGSIVAVPAQFCQVIGLPYG